MLLRYPHYYEEFSCIADRCPDSCCHEWEVEVDEASAEGYRQMEGPLGEDLRRFLYEEDGHTYLRNHDNRCPLWRSDGLCRIQAELGHEALCQVCQTFPRLRHDYGDFVDLGLELSCPEAARLILNSPRRFHWEDLPGGEEPEYDTEVMDLLKNTHGGVISMLSRPEYTIPQRLRLLLMYAHHVQAAIDGAKPGAFYLDAALREADGFAGAGDTGALVELYLGLDLLTSRWAELLKRREEPQWEEKFAAFAQYFVDRYWCQAVSDYDLVGRIKVLLSACALLARLPGGLEQKAQLWSKEIENSTDNFYALLDGSYSEPALTDANLLGLMR